ncbi:MAG: hypothetical protein J6A75_05165 [Lachnospiraceae bacterium]|nr:hypothetical protein [Lachnospiraceae bacterium]
MEKNHNWVYVFLHTYRYPVEDFYNHAIMGLIKGIQVYNRREDLRNKYDQKYICWQYMKSEVGNFFRIEKELKRKSMENMVSLDAENEEAENLYNCLGGKSVEAEYMEMETLEELLEKFSEIQRDILKLKFEGYNNKEVFVLLEIPSSTFYKEMQRIKAKMEKVVR